MSDDRSHPFFAYYHLRRAAKVDRNGFDGPLGSLAEIVLKVHEIDPDFALHLLLDIVAIDLEQAGFDPNEVRQELGLRQPDTIRAERG